MKLPDILKGKVVPVLDIRNPARAPDLVRLLADCGAPAVEIALRSPKAWESVDRARAAAPDLPVGVGSVLDNNALDRAVGLELPFAVSPGLSESMVQAARQRIVLIPGVATPSEVMAARSLGVHLVKLFPAEVLGGVDLLKALAGPFGDMNFFPTGGLRSGNYRNYLALANVHCVGATWLAPLDDIDEGNWTAIESRAVRLYKP